MGGFPMKTKLRLCDKPRGDAHTRVGVGRVCLLWGRADWDLSDYAVDNEERLMLPWLRTGTDAALVKIEDLADMLETAIEHEFD